MRMEAANSAVTMESGRRGFLAAPALNDNLTLEAIDRKHANREVPMYSNNSPRRMRRFTLGAALAVLALLLTPALLGQQSVQAGQAALTPRLEQSAATAQTAPQAPAAFSDALAAAPAGAQCSVEAHACSVPSADGAQALSSAETAVAYGFSQTPRSGAHNERL